MCGALPHAPAGEGRFRALENGEQRTENRTPDKRATGEIVVQRESQTSKHPSFQTSTFSATCHKTRGRTHRTYRTTRTGRLRRFAQRFLRSPGRPSAAPFAVRQGKLVYLQYYEKVALLADGVGGVAGGGAHRGDEGGGAGGVGPRLRVVARGTTGGRQLVGPSFPGHERLGPLGNGQRTERRQQGRHGEGRGLHRLLRAARRRHLRPHPGAPRQRPGQLQHLPLPDRPPCRRRQGTSPADPAERARLRRQYPDRDRGPARGRLRLRQVVPPRLHRPEQHLLCR